MKTIDEIKNKYLRRLVVALLFPFAFLFMWCAYSKDAYLDVKPIAKHAWKGMPNDK